MKNGQAVAYGKKIKLEEQPPDIPLPGYNDKDAHSLITLIKNQGIPVKVEKEAVIYQFETIPITTLELAYLHVANKAYFSVSIESRSLQLVESITKQLLKSTLACDYITFLKGITDE